MSGEEKKVYSWFLESDIEQTENLSGLLTAEIESEVKLNTSGHTALSCLSKMVDALCSVVCSMSSGAQLPTEELESIRCIDKVIPESFVEYMQELDNRAKLVRKILDEIGCEDVNINDIPSCDFIFSDELGIDNAAIQHWFFLMSSLSSARTNALLCYKKVLEKYHDIIFRLSEGAMFDHDEMRSVTHMYERAIAEHSSYHTLRLQERVYCTEIGFSSTVPIEG